MAVKKFMKEPADANTEDLLQLKRQVRDALLVKQQLIREHKVLERAQSMKRLQGLQNKALELTVLLKEAVSTPYGHSHSDFPSVSVAFLLISRKQHLANSVSGNAGAWEAH